MSASPERTRHYSVNVSSSLSSPVAASSPPFSTRRYTDLSSPVGLSLPPAYRPSSAEGRRTKQVYGGLNSNSSSSGNNKTGLQKIAAKMFRKEQRKSATKMVPGFFDPLDDVEGYRPGGGSPDGTSSPSHSGSGGNFNRTRSYSVGSRTALKLRRGGKEREEFFMWKPVKRKKCEWESMSGRQLTIKDIHMSQISKTELEALQQMAIARLQGMDISVSKSSIRSGKLKIVKRKSSNEKIGSKAVFGQPLTAVLDKDKTRGITSPIHTTAPPISSSPVPVAGGTTNTTSTCTMHQHPDQPIASPSNESDPLPTHEKPSSLVRQDSVLPVAPQVPHLVLKTIEHLDNNGIKTEGLFRVPGAKARIDMIKQKFDNGEDLELTEDTSPHDVACVFKEFFRSLPEPLMTRELYYPFLKTRKLTTRGQQKSALRYLVLLLPRPNRDTLHELLLFLNRVALHSNGIILIDGTEESGNRMTEDNLATVLGPNILHNESRSKSPQSNYSVMKQDPEELVSVCQVMADLIKMHDAIFTVPAELYDAALQHLFLFDHTSVDAIMRRKCLEMEEKESQYQSDENHHTTMTPSQETAASDLISPLPPLNHHSQSSQEDETDGCGQEGDHVIPRCLTVPSQFKRSHSLHDTEQSLDDVMKDLQDMLSEGLIMNRRHSSNDSAMGESECVTSPLQNPPVDSTHKTTPSCIYNSVDSAISNHSHQRSSSSSSNEGCAQVGEWLDELDSAFMTLPPTHVHTSSGISVHSESPGLASPLRVNSPKLGKGNLISSELAGSLPVLNPTGTSNGNPSINSLSRRSSSPFSLSKKFRKSNNSVHSSQDSFTVRNGSKKDMRSLGLTSGSKKKKYIGSLDDNMPVFDIQRSPILGRKVEVVKATPTPVPTTIFGDIKPRFHFVIQPSTEVLI